MNYLMVWLRLDLTKDTTTKRKVYMYDIAPRLAFVEYWLSFGFIFIYDHRHVDFTTASNTVTSSGFPPR